MESREGRFLAKLNDKITLIRLYLESDAIDNATYDDLLVRQEILYEIHEDFKKHEDALRANNNVTNERVEFEMAYLELMGKVRHKLRLTKPQEEIREQPNNFNEFLMQQTKFLDEFSLMKNQPLNHVKLPPINIPKFGGDYHEWPTFSNLFLQVHENVKLSKVQKFQYLKGLMVPNSTADEIIKHFTITDQNYDEAWQLLKVRFDKKRHVINALVRRFVDQPSTNQFSVTSLRNICDTTDHVMRGLRALGEEAESRDPFLIYMLLEKIDDNTKHAWAKETSANDFPTVDDFIKFLSKRCDALESVQSTAKKSSSNKSTMPRINSCVANSTIVCPKCNQSHFLHDCVEFKTLSTNERQQFVIERSLCFNCLRPGHRSNFCKGKKSCHKCNKRHHTLIHLTPSNNFANTGSQNASENAMRAHHTSIENNSPSTSTTQPDSQSSNDTNLPNSIGSFLCISSSRTDDVLSSNNVIHSTNNDLPVPVSMNQDFKLHHVDDANKTYSLINSRETDFKCNTLLPTASVYVMDASRYLQCCRALLDTGSHASFITESFAQRLSLQRFHARKHVSGIASCGVGYTRGYVELQIFSKSQNKIMTIQALVLKSLTSALPSQYFDISSWGYIQSLQLADSEFNIPNPVDILIGIEHTLELFTGNICRGPENYPCARESPFGWILSGNLPEIVPPLSACITQSEIQIVDSTDQLLRKFWEVENIPQTAVQTEDEKQCELSFRSSIKQSSTGRFGVRLPFKQNLNPLGNSLNKAVARLKSMERVFKKDPHIKVEYTKFMREYITLNHMTEIPQNEIELPNEQCFYLPHHAVLKADSTTTKLRVVFDGSSKTSSGFSINDNLLVGESLQPKLFAILLKFRRHKVAMVADIEKMFRQIEIYDDNDYQRIVWREEEEDVMHHYRLQTVTYGLVCSPFLATRSLRELSNNVRENLPTISKIIDEQFYVDDLMMGAETVEEAIQLRFKISEVLLSAGFPLRKWKANNPQLIATIPSEFTELTPLNIQDPGTSFKILGMQWVPHTDAFIFKVKPSANHNPTKRSILSEVASIYDPLGFLAPSVILMKMTLQILWLRNLNWDDPVPDDVKESWLTTRSQFESFNQLKIPRYAVTGEQFELHGFADASESAYAAAIYVRSFGDGNEIAVHLLAAKTKVAPLKTISIPRLELCAALLLARLMVVVKNALDLPNIATFYWSDSTTVLAWLSSHPNRWKSFIANRTSEILDSSERRNWYHVNSADNAADCASRGLMPNELKTFNLWWYGPKFLKNTNLEELLANPLNELFSDTVKREEKCKKTTVVVVNDTKDVLEILIQQSSSWWKLLRVLSFCIRFTKNCRDVSKSVRRRNLKIVDYNEVAPLLTSETREAHTVLIKLVQQQCFGKELKSIARSGFVAKGSSLLLLSPFVHSDGLLRVGGRLHHSALPFHAKHQIIMPKDHPVSILLIKYYHHCYFHAGTSLLISLLRQRYWIVNVRNTVKGQVHKCIKCFREKGQTMTQIMGDLPKARTLENVTPFAHTGIDYAGPIMVKEDKARKAKSYKGYIVLFVCFSTKAIHIEVVKDLTTERFLEAFSRFVSRRGYPSVIYTDNGTNFVGADRELKRLFAFMNSESHNKAIIEQLSRNQVEWKFIPPNSPHFGGLWEAGVKSVKQHMKKAMDTNLTYDEFCTMFCQIESLLNSRPLCPVSDDPTDLNYLTPGHFLVGKPLTMIPSPDLNHIPDNRLSNWQFLQKKVQGFWKTWRMDYLASLQQRPKWRSPVKNIEKGALVLLKDDHLPPGMWKLARVIECYPGLDEKIRVVDIKTQDGILRRPVHKLCLLPISN